MEIFLTRMTVLHRIAMRIFLLVPAPFRMEADVETRESHRNEETQGDRHAQPASKNPAATAGDAIEMVPTEEIAVAQADMGGPPAYIEENWDRLVDIAQHLAELKAAK